MSRATRKLPEGFSGSQGEFRYPEPGLKCENWTYKEWKPFSSLQDQVIKFKLKTGPNEVIR